MSLKFDLNGDKIRQHNISQNNEIWHMVFILNSNAVITFNKSVFKVRAYNILIASPDDFYYINNDADFLSFAFKADSQEEINISSGIFELKNIELQLFDSFLSSRKENEREALLQLILIRCARHYSDFTPQRDKKSRLFKEAVGLMERFLMKSFTAAELAGMLRTSLSSLKRVFAELSGMGVHEYLLMLKLKKAREMLLSGKSVTKTAESLRFSSQAYFSACFKRETGTSAKCYFRQIEADNRKNDLPDYLL